VPAAAQSLVVDNTFLVNDVTDDVEPTLSGDRVYFVSDRSGSPDIVEVLAPDFVAPISVGPGAQEDVRLSGDAAVWSDTASGDYEIILYDAVTALATDISEAPGLDYQPEISGDTVVWVSSRTGSAEIVYWQRALPIVRLLASTPGIDAFPSVDGDLVAWRTTRPGDGFDLVASRIGSGVVSVLDASAITIHRPSVSGNLIAYLADNEVRVVDADTGAITSLTSDGVRRERVILSGNWVYWDEDTGASFDLFAYDLVRGQRYLLSDAPYDEYLSDAEGQSVVYTHNAAGNFDIGRIDFRVNAPPVANAGDNLTVTVGDAANLLASGSDADGDPIVSYAWVIESLPEGSGATLNSAAVPNPTLIPDAPGTYVLSVVVSDGLDSSAPDSVTVVAVEDLPPVAAITALPVSGVAPLSVQFDGSSSYDPEGSALAFSWDFGDLSAASTAVSPTHLYEDPGLYVATLRVTDGRGQIGTDSVVITVEAPANQPPKISPSALPVTGDAPLVVEFSAHASDPEGDVLTYAWDLGDPSSGDNTSALAEPTQTYVDPGTYVAWLTVSDSFNEVSASLTIVVGADHTFSVSAVVVKFDEKRPHQGRVSLWADFDHSVPQAGDALVAVSFDGIVLLRVPFADLVPGGQEGVYWYREQGMSARFNFVEHELFVYVSRANLVTLDNSNGVVVELNLGDGTAVEVVPLRPSQGHRLIYVRPEEP